MRFIDSQYLGLMPVADNNEQGNLKVMRKLDAFVKVNVYPSVK